MSVVTLTPLYKPHAKQILLHDAPVGFDEISLVLYGGQRGGGKSAGALMDAIMFATTYPHAKCCILRETLGAVRSSFLEKLPVLFPEKQRDPISGNMIQVYRWQEKASGVFPDRSMIFPNGSFITFQRVADYKEAKSKQGFEFHYLCVDELTKQTKRTFDYLLSCVRSTTIMNPYTGKPLQIPTKVVGGCNPGGIGHKWVKQEFIDTTTVRKHPETNAPIQTRDYVYYVEHPDPHTPDVRVTVRFIPASWQDNPHLSPAYVAMLNRQPEAQRKMDMEGNWDIVAGKMFEYEEDSYISVRDSRELEDNAKVVDTYISIDWGYKPSFHSAGWHHVFEDGSVVRFKQMYGQELIFEDFVKEIADKSDGYDITATLLPHDMYRHGDRYRDNDGRIMGETKAEVFAYMGLNPVGVESGKGKVDERFDKIHSASKIEIEQNGKTIKKFRISKACVALKDELDNAVHDEFNPGKLAKACKDHALDDWGLFLMYYSSDIAPMGYEEMKVEIDTRSSWRKKMEQEEEDIRRATEQNISYDDYTRIQSDWDL